GRRDHRRLAARAPRGRTAAPDRRGGPRPRRLRLVPRPAPLRQRAARRLRARLRADRAVHDRHEEHPRRDPVPARAGLCGVLVVVRIVRLGADRSEGEGLRIGTVRRPPRGVPKSELAARNFYDVWFPNLAPSEELLKRGLRAETEREWRAFARAYRSEMKSPENRRTLDLLAALSHQANFSVGCYCEDESRCHRSPLRELLA